MPIVPGACNTYNFIICITLGSLSETSVCSMSLVFIAFLLPDRFFLCKHLSLQSSVLINYIAHCLTCGNLPGGLPVGGIVIHHGPCAEHRIYANGWEAFRCVDVDRGQERKRWDGTVRWQLPECCSWASLGLGARYQWRQRLAHLNDKGSNFHRVWLAWLLFDMLLSFV